MLHGKEFLEYRLVRDHVRAMLAERQLDRLARAGRAASAHERGRPLDARTTATRPIGRLRGLLRALAATASPRRERRAAAARAPRCPCSALEDALAADAEAAARGVTLR